MRRTFRYSLLGVLLFGLLLTYATFVQQTLVWGVEYTLLAYTTVAVPYILLAQSVRRAHATLPLAVNSVAVLLLFASSAAPFAYGLFQYITVGASAGFLDMAILQTVIAVFASLLTRILQKRRRPSRERVA
jgi:hypothetical protein